MFLIICFFSGLKYDIPESKGKKKLKKSHLKVTPGLGRESSCECVCILMCKGKMTHPIKPPTQNVWDTFT